MTAAICLAPLGQDSRANPPPATSNARPLVTIIGQLSYRDRAALPAGATLLVTLAEPGIADPNAPLLDRQRLDLAGQQVPLTFRLTAVAATLKAGQHYALRAVIQDAAGQPLWSSQSGQVIDPTQGLHDLGTLWLTRSAASTPALPATPPTPGIAFLCADRQVTALYRDGGLDLTVDGQTYRLTRPLTALGGRYRGRTTDQQEISFWSRGRNARLSLGAETEMACAQTAIPEPDVPGIYKAQGQGPDWTLSLGPDHLDLVRFGTGKSAIARLTLPERQLLADGYRYVGRLGDAELQVTVNPGLCLDERTRTPLPDHVQVQVGEQTLRGCGGSAASVLLARDWRVTRLNGQPLPADQAPSLQFAGTGEMTLYGGCNGFVARFHADLNGITIAGRSSQTASSDACPPEVMTREQALLSALRSVQRHTIDTDGALILSGLDAAEIRLEAVEKP